MPPEISIDGIEVVSVNLGVPTEVFLGRSAVETGICKKPSTEVVVATSVGLEGDFKSRSDPTGHQAVCAYSLENYTFWSEHFKSALAPGTFGENLTLRGAPEDAVHLGGRFVGEEVELEVTYPRTPCKKLNVHLEKRFSGSFLQSGRVGYYLRVLKPGRLFKGERLSYRANASLPTVREFVQDALVEYWDPVRLEELANVESLSGEWRARLLSKVPRARQSRGWIGLRSLVIEQLSWAHDVASVTLSCWRGQSLPALARQDTLSFDHRGDLLSATRPIVSEATREGIESDASERPRVRAYCLNFRGFPRELDLGAIIRARAPSSLLQV